ncbi:uncharacterized protein J3D65DRAFT_273176 [Phyllosticta citribraziliensis]|uniref:Uncharacterized protein n=1 Tax=Phyllosticta citribraziliensis TaxID=989973 RepID=A0ABR1M1B2_9PEZI
MEHGHGAVGHGACSKDQEMSMTSTQLPSRLALKDSPVSARWRSSFREPHVHGGGGDQASRRHGSHTYLNTEAGGAIRSYPGVCDPSLAAGVDRGGAKRDLGFGSGWSSCDGRPRRPTELGDTIRDGCVGNILFFISVVFVFVWTAVSVEWFAHRSGRGITSALFSLSFMVFACGRLLGTRCW